MVVGILLSYWEGNFSGAMLNFQGVEPPEKREANLHSFKNADPPP